MKRNHVTVKKKKAEVHIFFNKELHRIRGLKGMCRNKIKRNHTHDFSSFYSDTFPLILVFYAAFYWRIYLYFLHFNSSVQQIFWHCPFLLSFHLAGHNRRWIDTDTIDRYYWSCWLPIVPIHRLKKFPFFTNSIDHRFEKKFCFSIELNHRLRIFFLLKTIDLIDVFYSKLIIGIDQINIFFAIGAQLWLPCCTTAEGEN